MVAKRKKCPKCGTALSIYNDGDFCFAHTEGMPIYEHIPITQCTSYEDKRDRLKGSKLKVYLNALEPGDEGYNERAFSKVMVGVVGPQQINKED